MGISICKCPNCAKDLMFDSADRKVTCWYCRAEIGSAAFEAGHREPEPEPEPAVRRQDEPASEPAERQDKSESMSEGRHGEPEPAPAEYQYEAASEPTARQNEPISASAEHRDKPDPPPPAPPRETDWPTFGLTAKAIPASAARGTREALDAGGIVSASCPSCGTGFYCGRKLAAAVCPRCGNAKIAEERAADERAAERLTAEALKIDYIIPFKYGKNDAAKALADFCEGRPLLPDSFAAMNRVTSLRGVYVPFWLFDAEAAAHANYSGYAEVPGGIYGGKQYDHYSITRKADAAFENVPVDASRKMDDAYMDAVRPYDFSEMADFRPSYLAEYPAIRPDAGAAESRRRFDDMVKVTFSDNFKNTVYDYQEEVSAKYDIKRGKESCALLPVWVLDAHYDGADYTFMINGQNGRVAGRLPTSGGKAWKYRALHVGAWGALFTSFSYIFVRLFEIYVPMFVPMILALVAAAVAGLFTADKRVIEWEKDMDNTMQDAGAFDYVVPGSFLYTEKEDTYLGRSQNRNTVDENDVF